MKKNLGLFVTIIGLLMIGGGFALTPAHSLNPGDSISGVDASATLVFSGFIVFGIGLVIYASTIAFPGEKARQSA